MGKIIIAVLVLAVLGGIVFFYGGSSKVSAPAEDGGSGVSLEVPAGDNTSVEEAVVEDAARANVVTYTKDGFSPSNITVAVGSEVVFENESPRGFWPASALHPTHAVYDGTTMSEHCLPAQAGVDEASGAFDACKGIAPNGEWSFTFSKAGEWKYHDHLNASRFGTVVVE